MPAKNLYREDKEGIYSHIYNKGVEKRIIFNDEKDYEVFQGFLKDYLTAPQDPKSIKKSFTVHGRVFQGTPHQPKNYFNKVELIAYSLMPSHFHLLLHQKVRGALESFIRSLCTRYSMYFNKKYQHTGALFEGPYKSVQIKDEARMLHLTRYLHRGGGYSSYLQYLGKAAISWVKPEVVQSFFESVKTDLPKKTHSYKDFVEKYEPDQKEKELIKDIIFESETQHLDGILEGRDLAGNLTSNADNKAMEAHTEPSEEIHLERNLKPLQRIPEVAVITLVFLVLVTVGIRNVNSPPHKVLESSDIPAVTLTPTPTPTPAPIIQEKIIPKTIVKIKIDDDATASAIVNIREKPTTDSEKIGQARDGDTFEFVSLDSNWYEVKLATRSGFISAAYVEQEEQTNEK